MLNEYQRNSLCVAMQLIEEKMRDIERLLDHPGHPGLMYDVEDDITPEMTQTVRDALPKVYSWITVLRDRFGLPRKTRMARREMLKGISQLWVMLEESYSKKLRRYGAVDPRLALQLDPAIEALSHLMLELEQIAMANGPSVVPGKH